MSRERKHVERRDAEWSTIPPRLTAKELIRLKLSSTLAADGRFMDLMTLRQYMVLVVQLLALRRMRARRSARRAFARACSINIFSYGEKD